jgi:branched-chain amino acid transport system substrate-binding protein
MSIPLSRRLLLQTATAAGLVLAASPAFAVDPIRIGFGMSLTGPNAGAGKMFLVGREVWREEINAKGGLLGRPVEFVYYDDQSNPSLVPGIYSKLIDATRSILWSRPLRPTRSRRRCRSSCRRR